MKLKQVIKGFIETFGLGQTVDKIRFNFHRWSNREKIAKFKRDNPGVPLPSEFMIYETFRLDYDRYLQSGREDAQWLKDLVSPHMNLSDKSILDWGCGPGRIIRHFPAINGNSARYYGCDYNDSYVAWCAANLHDIAFFKNDIHPPLASQDNSIDLAYAISIFTHLAEDSHDLWMREMHRVLNNKGIFVFTTHGDITKANLMEKEKAMYDSGKIVLRGNVKEGYRMYTAYHPPSFIRNLVSPLFDVLEHIPGERKSWGFSQDVWVVRKK